MSNKILNYMYHALFDFCHFTNIYLLTKIESQNLFLIRINYYKIIIINKIILIIISEQVLLISLKTV